MAKLLQKRADPNVQYCLPYGKFIDECDRVELVVHDLPPLPGNKPRSGHKSYCMGDLKQTVFSEVNGHKVEMELVMFEFEIQASMTLNEGVLAALPPVNHGVLGGFMEDPDGPMETIRLLDTGTLNMVAYRQGNGNPPFIVTNLHNARGMRGLFRLMFGLPADATFPPLSDHVLTRMVHE